MKESWIAGNLISTNGRRSLLSGRFAGMSSESQPAGDCEKIVRVERWKTASSGGHDGREIGRGERTLRVPLATRGLIQWVRMRSA